MAAKLESNGPDDKPIAEPVLDETSVDALDRFLYPGIEIAGDITAPLYTDEEWEEFEASSRQLEGKA
jgi:hypothetical protein